MREFLLELYLKYGEREFEYAWREVDQRFENSLFDVLLAGFIINREHESYTHNNTVYLASVYQLTPKALEYIKNLDNP